MYLAGMSQREAAAFLRLAHLMIRADGIVSDDEESMLEDIQAELGLQSIANSEMVDLELACSEVTSIDRRARMLLELASLAYVDGDYDDRERVLLREIARLWEVDLVAVMHVEEWGRRRLALTVEAVHLIHEISVKQLKHGFPHGGVTDA